MNKVLLILNLQMSCEHYIPKNIPYLGAAGTWTIGVEDLKTKAAPENVKCRSCTADPSDPAKDI